MILLRRFATVLLSAACLVVLVREPPLLRDSDESTAASRPYASELHRLLAHQVDTIRGVDFAAARTLTISFPHRQPVVGLLFRAACPACQVAKPGWEKLIARIESRARVIAATLDPPPAQGRFFDVDGVTEVRLDLADFQRAFAVWEVVPITLLIEPTGEVSWVRFGPLDEGSINSLVAAMDR